jgi:GT2 family glycosyltransferase
VSVVTVNHNGAHHLPDLLQSLRAQTFRDFEVLLVDNASSDGSVALLRRRYPWVRVVEAPTNSGFVGGNNLGFDAAHGELFALLNNDTAVEPRWLEALVAEMDRDPDIGVVGSKILFARPFLDVELAVEPTFSPARAGMSTDARELGAFVAEGSGFVGCTYRKPIWVAGFHGPERIGDAVGRWTGPCASLSLPVERRDREARLRLHVGGGGAPAGRRVRVKVAGCDVGDLAIGARIGEHELIVPRHVVAAGTFEVINNAGSLLAPDGSGGDRGIYERDRGQYDEAEDMQAFCGCSALVRRRALEVVGCFDRDLFMYFEDTELSWRLRRRGFRLRYQPASTARHYHAATSVEGSPTFNFLVARNRILMLIRHGVFHHAVRGYVEEVARLLWVLHKRRSLGAHEVGVRLRVQVSLMKRAPRALLKRWGVLREPGPGRPRPPRSGTWRRMEAEAAEDPVVGAAPLPARRQRT